MILHREDFGNQGDIPLVLLHGLMGQGRNLSGIARVMSDSRHVITLDLRNHGSSPWHDRNGYDDMAADVLETLAEYAQFDVMGHSMGGKVAMTIALSEPARIRRAMVADIAPIAYEHSYFDEISALLALNLDEYDKRSDVDAALAGSIPDPGMRAFFIHGLQLRPEKRWVNNLVALRDNLDLITGWPESSNIYDDKIAFVRGEASDYLDAAARKRVTAYFPNAVHSVIAGAGHWLHVEKPKAFQEVMYSYFV